MRDVVIIGGGLTGCALAWALSRRGRRVVVLERAVVGAEASSAAAGILAPRVEAHGVEPFRSMGIASLDLYGDWVAPLGDVGFRRCGAFVHGERPDADAVAREGGWWLAEEATVDTRRLVGAVRDVSGATFVTGDEVVSLDAAGVVLASGTHLPGEVVVCAGAWTSRVCPAIPVRPVRGQLVALDARIDSVVFGAGGYLVPRHDEVVCGTTTEEVGFERGVTAEGVAGVLRSAVALHPALAGARFLRAWSGFRPTSPDGLPIVGNIDGVWVASGHYRNGILLAPLTAKLLAAAICREGTLPEAWSPARFRAR